MCGNKSRVAWLGIHPCIDKEKRQKKKEGWFPSMTLFPTHFHLAHQLGFIRADQRGNEPRKTKERNTHRYGSLHR